MRNTVPPCPERLSEADRLCWEHSDPGGDDRKWREKKFRKLPSLFQMPAAREYCKRFKSQGRTAANTFLRQMVDTLAFSDCALALDEEAVKAYSKARVREVESIRNRCADLAESYSHACKLVEARGFNPPVLKGYVTEESALTRMSDPRWWKRQIRRVFPARFEGAAIQCGMVHAKASVYISDESFRAWNTRKQRNATTLADLALENEEGDIYSLAELVALSVANPVNRRNELMARLDGFDRIAKDLGHTGIFITITCPSRMHARYRKSGKVNPKYDRTTPHQAQQYLCKLWARIRARLKHRGVNIYGFRIAEPQHDGTPHWHILLYCDSESVPEVRDMISRHALADSPNEKGASKRRCLFEVIDRSKGSGIAYIAKYISKNIDGAHVEKDLYGRDAKQAALRVRAWASIHHIRQFQQFGGPPVSVWRELRKAPGSPHEVLEQARSSADQGDWKSFTEALGGTQINRADQHVKLEKEFSAECGLYGEPKGYLTVGVTDGLEVLLTRVHTWKLVKSSAAAREAASPRLARGSAHLEFCQ